MLFYEQMLQIANMPFHGCSKEQRLLVDPFRWLPYPILPKPKTQLRKTLAMIWILTLLPAMASAQINPCQVQYISDMQPGGIIDGRNTVFTLQSSTTTKRLLSLTLNGLVLNSMQDYQIAGDTITFINGVIPQVGDLLRAAYVIDCPSTHSILSTSHPDTTPATLSRGDLIVAQGTPPKLSRLGLGASNSCLTSNGVDVLWTTCIGSSVAQGSIAIGGSSSSLSSSPFLLFDSQLIRLGVGKLAPSTTLHVMDDRANNSSPTSVWIQSSTNQQSTPLTRWLNPTGLELARVDSDGSLSVQRLTTSTNSTRSAWRDTGSNIDPQAKNNGDFWFNNSQQARKSFEAGQVHPMSQVVCSSTGGAISTATSTTIGSCLVPAFFIDGGDRLEVRFGFLHSGAASSFTVDFGVTTIISGLSTRYPISVQSFTQADKLIGFHFSGGVHGNGIFWDGTFVAGDQIKGVTANTQFNPTSQLRFDFRASLSPASSDVVSLLNYTIIRYPAQYNP